MQTRPAPTVRRAVTTDQARLAALLSDMQAHYGLPDPPGGTERVAHLLTRAGNACLYVTEASRGLGLGRTLLAAAARAALEEDYCRIDWATDVTNAGAQRL